MQISYITLFVILNVAFGADVRLLNLEPPDAQQYIDRQDTTLKYAPKIQSNVPGVRFIGNQPHHVVEDIYLANQYHGQDGIGGYLYGYSVPDIAKTEKKKAGGDLRGAYNYIAGNGQEIKVQYWDDGTGFHQVDNVPKALPKDNKEVREAKEKFLRIWHEEAERNSKPIANPYDNNGQYASGPLSVQGQQQQQQRPYQQFPQYQNQQQQQHPYQQFPQYQNQQQYQGLSSENVNQYQAQPTLSKSNPNEDDGTYRPESEEEQGPPKGFFYNFDYPVGIIVQKDGARIGDVQKRESDVKDIYTRNKAVFEQQLHGAGSRPSRSYTGYVYVPQH